MDARPLIEDSSLPLVVAGGPKAAAATLAEWAAGHRSQLNVWLHQAGGVLFRGFGVHTVAEFRDISIAVQPELKAYVGGDSPRNRVADGVYTSTEFPPHVEIGLHNEMSYASWWPARLFFYCQTPAIKGGETQIADSRRVLAHLDATVRRRFGEKGVLYEQHLRHAEGPPGPGKSWQETFETEDRAAVETLMHDGGMTWEWTDRGLRTSIRRAAIIAHPESGDPVWFNQANLWHAESESAKKWDAAPCELHHHARYGDGSEISAADLDAIQSAYDHSEITFPWEAGDVLMLDNHLTMHGRKPFEGPRAVFVALA